MTVVYCDTPNELLHLLNDIQREPAFGWFFRGQARACWTLVPSLLRERSVEEAQRHENDLLVNLRRNLSQRSTVPDRLLTKANEDSLLALAQHYGCQTRLLDWSRSAAVAAYFAASGALRERLDGDKNFAVFAFSGELSAPAELAGVRVWPDAYAGSVVIEPLQGPNVNIAAQSGVLIKHDWHRRDFWLGEYNTPSMRGEHVRHTDEILSILVTRMTRYELAAKHAPDLLGLLRQRGVDAITVFPGLDGFAREATDGTYLMEGTRRLIAAMKPP